MSFILDALRKSDAERQRSAAPGLADVRYAPRPQRRSVWVPILVVALVANMLFMAVQWFGNRGTQPDPAAAPQGEVAGAPAVPATPPAAPPADAPPAIRPLAREAEFGEPEPEPPPAGNYPAAPAPPRPVPGMVEAPVPDTGPLPAVAPPAIPATVPAAPANSSPPARPSRILSGNDLPTAEQLIGSGSLNIPMLNLDLHVYSQQPARRFVVINTRKYREGAQLTEGPTVEAITAEGVILANQGKRFTLARK
jgi:general secretion pathway protein B